ncbi:C4-dicarboxylate ABC transporter substrate-binding protein [Opitutaceae bacterium EW11]|nr:C4-dicarboxylate ABC transporter substrate-binding protein [Opitutaceae bacterium EW11]
MDTPKEKKRLRIVTTLIETFGFSPAVATAVALFLGIVCLLAVVWVVRSAPSRTIVLTTGPEGSSFQRWAAAYQKSLATHGVTLEIRPSAGSQENLQRLQSAAEGIDVGFVPSGLAKGGDVGGVVSLGSIAYQPLWVFYRNAAPFGRLADLAGKRIAVGAPGSGTRNLALALLQANGISGAPTTFSDSDADAAAADLLAGKLDAVFLMGDSASLQTLRTLIRTPEVQLFHFAQADAYVRRFDYLNKMVLPRGSIDLGKDLPGQDVFLVGPTVELVARKGLNSALSDLLLEVAKEVHGKASLLTRRGEFPAAIEHEIPVSDDALRYYKSGKGIFYRTIHSFWLASLLNRILVAVVPLVLVIVPAIRFLPLAFRLSVQLRLYRCYRPLLRIERETFVPLSAERRQELLRRLDDIEETVNRLKVPASFADRFYWLRSHLASVRQRLLAAATRPA